MGQWQNNWVHSRPCLIDSSGRTGQSKQRIDYTDPRIMQGYMKIDFEFIDFRLFNKVKVR